MTYRYTADPNRCPHCLHHVAPRALLAHRMDEQLHIVYVCTNRACGKAFIGSYESHPDYRGPVYGLRSITPRPVQPRRIDPRINKISPTFSILVTQAATADGLGLGEIAGAGYRKALEFLVKDYVGTREPERADEAKQAFLGNVMKNFLPDGNLKRCAERATWLGNDETHYVRIWDEHDLKDRKVLIELTESWMLNEEQTQEYVAHMPGNS